MGIEGDGGALVLRIERETTQQIEPLHWEDLNKTYRKSADGVDGEGVSLVVAHLCGIVRWICGNWWYCKV